MIFAKKLRLFVVLGFFMRCTTLQGMEIMSEVVQYAYFNKPLYSICNQLFNEKKIYVSESMTKTRFKNPYIATCVGSFFNDIDLVTRGIDEIIDARNSKLKKRLKRSVNVVRDLTKIGACIWAVKYFIENWDNYSTSLYLGGTLLYGANFLSDNRIRENKYFVVIKEAVKYGSGSVDSMLFAG